MPITRGEVVKSKESRAKPLADASRRCAFQAAISFAEVLRVRRLVGGPQ
jgi:hypothetical protein